MADDLVLFLLTIVLQLQIDFAFGGWKIASALLRNLTRKTLPELCCVPLQASSLRGSLRHSRLRPQRNKSIILEIQPHVCDGIFLTYQSEIRLDSTALPVNLSSIATKLRRRLYSVRSPSTRRDQSAVRPSFFITGRIFSSAWQIV